MHDRSTRAARGALILGLGLTAFLPATAQAQDRTVDHDKLSNANPPVLEVYKRDEINWLVGAYGTVNGVQAVPAFDSDDLFRSNPLPFARAAGGGFEVEKLGFFGFGVDQGL